MAHRRVKNIEFDDDYSYEDEYDDEDESKLPPDHSLTVSEREQLRLAAQQVRIKLGTLPHDVVSEQRIKEELWNSWYDVDAVVAKILPIVRAQAAKSSRPQAGSSANGKNDQGVVSPDTSKNAQLKPKKTGSSDLQTDIQSLKIEPKVERKNLKVLEEFKKSGLKKSVSFVVVGHVDHGKSTLMGRLLLDLELVSQQTVRKFRKEATDIGKSSFALAWIMDESQDERERGVTVDTATKVFETKKTKFTIIDAPGHHDFIPNMIAGASQADFALLVIDAGINAFEAGVRGQTREHALLVRSMGVKKIVVVVNKMDLVEWDEARFEEITQQMTAFLATANFPSSKITFVPCSGLNGTNILKKLNIPEAKWYTGPTLIEVIDNVNTTEKVIDGPLRLRVDSVIRSPSGGWVEATGRIDSGNVQVGDPVTVQPSTQTAVVRSIIADEEPQDWAVAGQMVNLKLVNIETQFVNFGDTICDPAHGVPNLKTFKAKILTMDHVMPMFVEVHSGRLQVSGRIAKLVAQLDKATGEVEKKNPRVAQPGMVIRVNMDLDEQMPMEAGVRIVLRADGVTVATGLVE